MIMENAFALLTLAYGLAILPVMHASPTFSPANKAFNISGCSPTVGLGNDGMGIKSIASFSLFNFGGIPLANCNTYTKHCVSIEEPWASAATGYSTTGTAELECSIWAYDNLVVRWTLIERLLMEMYNRKPDCHGPSRALNNTVEHTEPLTPVENRAHSFRCIP